MLHFLATSIVERRKPDFKIRETFPIDTEFPIATEKDRNEKILQAATAMRAVRFSLQSSNRNLIQIIFVIV
jgi:hypothetical protein